MRVARVVAKLEPGGAQLSLLRVARILGSRGHQTRLLVGYATDAGVALARAHGLEPELMGTERDLQWRCDPEFTGWLEPRLRDADVIHAHMFGAWWAAGHAAPPETPLAASEHNALNWPEEPQESAMSEVVARIDRFYAHGPGARTVVIRAGMPEPLVARGLSPVEGFDATELPGLPKPRIVYTGRLAADKGVDVLIEAIALMTAPPPVLILGTGPLENELRARIEATGLADVVRLCGWAADPAPFVAGASVQVCPSRDEALSQAAILAMALGVPVVGTSVDGFPGTLGDNRGLILQPGDPAELAEALEGVLSGRLVTDLAGARVWAQRFEPGRVTDLYESDYLGLRRLVAA